MRAFLPKMNTAIRRMPIPLRLVFGLLFLVSLGTMILMVPGVGQGDDLTIREAFFTAVSALTVTGLTVITPSQDLTLMGQIFLMLLIQIGGVGYTVVAVIFFRLLGRKVSFADRLALRDSFGLLSMNAIVKLVLQALKAVLAIELLGAILLWIHWYPNLGLWRAGFYALFHSISAFCNAGFDLFNGLPGHSGVPNDPVTLGILAVLIFLGGLGIPVVANLVSTRERMRLTLHTRLTLIMAVSLIAFGALGLFMAETRPGGTLEDESTGSALYISVFQSISARTAGFSAMRNFEEITPPSQVVNAVLMFIGSAPVSMGGGITTGTFTVLVLAIWAYARGRDTPTVFGRKIGAATVRRASAVLMVSFMVIIASTWLLLMTNTQATLEYVVFEVVSAFATCGLSLGLTTQLNGVGQVIIALVMLWGRLGALTVIMALAQLSPPALVDYPEEQVFI